MSCMKRYAELGSELDKKTTPKPLSEYTKKEWYKYAYKSVTGKSLPLFWKFNQAILETYLPANIIDTVAEQGMLY